MDRIKCIIIILLYVVLIISIQHSSAEVLQPSLRVEPKTALVDQPVTIDVTGCIPGQVVLLRAIWEDNNGFRWESHATFEADAEGRVNPAKMSPKAGTYDVLDAMGLFWSMVIKEGANNQTRYTNNKLEPLVFVVQIEIDGEVLESQKLIRQQILPSVTRQEVREKGLVGTLFLPKTVHPVGAIMVLGGSGGGLNEDGAALLASHGFATLALAYFRIDSLPEELSEIPLEYFETAIRYLGDQKLVDSNRIAVQGGSRGGELALLLGATFSQIRAVVAYAPSGVIWRGCCSLKASMGSAWTYKGKPIIPIAMDMEDPEVRAWQMERSAKTRAGEPMDEISRYLFTVSKATNLDKATIPVERTQGAILFISGKDDEVWPSEELAEISVNRLRENKFPFKFDHLSYRDAGHSIRYPFFPTTVNQVKHSLAQRIVKFGGTPSGIAKASVDSWNRVLTFYEEMIGQKNDQL